MASANEEEGGNNFLDRDPEELFCLRWNDFKDNVMNTLTVLRDEEDFFDVTLAVDGKQLRAHKLILSACSFFFRRLLKLNPAPNPVIVLWDVSYDDMVNLIDFMYHGEVKVKHANIQNFLAVAEKFRVRGLCQNDSSGGPSSPKSPESQNQGGGGGKSSRKRPRHSSGGGGNGGNTGGNSSNSKESKEPSSKRSTSDAADVEQSDNDAIVDENDVKSELHIADDDADHSDDDIAERHVDTEMGGGASGSASAGGKIPLIDPSALLEMTSRLAPSILDPTSKEFWRRAAAMGINQAALGAAAASNSPSAGGSGGNNNGSQVGSPSGNSILDGSGLRKPRSVYSSNQIHQLETFFRQNEYIDGERKRQLSLLTNIPEQQVKVWFQNRRQKKKRELEAATTGHDQPHMMMQQQQQQQQQRSTGLNFPPLSAAATAVAAAAGNNLGPVDPGELSS